MHTYLQIASLTITIVLCAAAAGQESKSELHEKLKSESAQDVAAAIESIPDDSPVPPDLVQQLAHLLEDERFARREGPLSFRVCDFAEKKLSRMPPTVAMTILDEVPRLNSDQARERAFNAIGRIGKSDRRLYELVLPYCSADDSELRTSAAFALDAIADHSNESVLQFAKLLNDSTPNVKFHALYALDRRSELIDPVIPDLIKLLDDDSAIFYSISSCGGIWEELRGRVARLLGKLGPRATAALPKLRTLTGRKSNKNVRVWSAMAICKISREPQPAMLKLLGRLLLDDSKHEFVQNEAAEAIAELGPIAFPLLDSLERAKRHKSAVIRCELVDAFFAVDPDTAVSRCLPLMRNREELVVEDVIRNFGERGISDPRVIVEYIRVLRSRSEDSFSSQKYHAVVALGKLGPAAKRAVPALEKLAQHRNLDDSLKADIAAALERIR